MMIWDSKSAVFYYLENLNQCPVGMKIGEGVSVGEIVEVHIDRKRNKIQWIVNNKRREFYSHPMLGDKNIKLRPYI